MAKKRKAKSAAPLPPPDQGWIRATEYAQADDELKSYRFFSDRVQAALLHSESIREELYALLIELDGALLPQAAILHLEELRRLMGFPTLSSRESDELNS